MTTPTRESPQTVAARAARAGGDVARRRLGRPGYLTWRGPRDVTTEASLEVQEAVVSTIRAAFPDAGILAAEGPEDAAMPVDAAELWIVDPVAGSLNFAHGIPHFAVTVALRRDGKIVLGAIYDPCRDELFEAADAAPALLNGDKIVVRQILEGSEAWESAAIGADWPRDGEPRRQARLILGLMADQVQACNLMGSPALGFAAVAAGRLHAYWHLDLNIWDVAAASVILERAGAILTDAEGRSWLYSEGGYIASNDVIHGSVLNAIQSVRRMAGRGGFPPRG